MKEEEDDDVLTPLTKEEKMFWGEAGDPWTGADICNEDGYQWAVLYVYDKVYRGEDLKYWLHMCQLTKKRYEDGLEIYKEDLKFWSKS